MGTQRMKWPRPIDILTAVLWCTRCTIVTCLFVLIVRISCYLKAEERISDTCDRCHFLATKPILNPTERSSFFIPNVGSGIIYECHVGSSIVNNLYAVGGSIGIPITGSKIRNSDHVCISIDISSLSSTSPDIPSIETRSLIIMAPYSSPYQFRRSLIILNMCEFQA